MPRITEELVRKRAEHNNCEIFSLEELSLHQQEIERIEHLDRWCCKLKILYLQNNLIPRIENVSRLKELMYLNLALNNVEKIENLEGCEFLQKLDLTVNFVGDLLSVESLRSNVHLRELYLTGNPCTDYRGYREFVTATLPQLKYLDGKEISKSERIVATQKLESIRQDIIEQQKEYAVKRELEKKEHEEKKTKRKDGEGVERKPGFDQRWYTDPNAHLSKEGAEKGQTDPAEERKDDGDGEYWDEPTAYTPESRIEMHEYMAEKRKEKGKEPNNVLAPQKRVPTLEKDGKLMNVNEGRYNFHLDDEEANNRFLLEVDCPRFMDTSLMDCDVQPTHIKLTIKGKVLQLVLPEEVAPDSSSAKRSRTTGKLLITMPKAMSMVRKRTKPTGASSVPGTSATATTSGSLQLTRERNSPSSSSRASGDKHLLLEVDPTVHKKGADIANIVKDKEMKENGGADSIVKSTASAGENKPLVTVIHKAVKEPPPDFIDDPDVPPLL